MFYYCFTLMNNCRNLGGELFTQSDIQMPVSFHLYLKNQKRKNGEQPVYLRITKDRKHKYMSTGISLLENQWNPDKEEVRRNHPNHKTLNEILQLKIRQAVQAQNDLLRSGKESAKAIQQKLKNEKDTDFFSLADQWYDELVAEGKYHQSKAVKVALKKLEEFEGERFLPLNGIDTAYLERFEKYLSITYKNKASTIHKNFKTIRKVIKTAIKLGLINDNPLLLFESIKQTKSTQKVKLTIHQIRAIEELELKPGKNIWHIRNAFLFSFYSGGIRFGDICRLQWDNVKNGRLQYRMHKNDKPFSTVLNDNQKEILSRYSGEGTEYIFPFLNNSKTYSELELRKTISSRNAIVNGKNEAGNKTGLKEIANLAGIDENVSFHVSRHSFAQYAVEKGLGVYELMQTLRHSKIETTQQYLKGLDEELADKAMRKIF